MICQLCGSRISFVPDRSAKHLRPGAGRRSSGERNRLCRAVWYDQLRIDPAGNIQPQAAAVCFGSGHEMQWAVRCVDDQIEFLQVSQLRTNPHLPKPGTAGRSRRCRRKVDGRDRTVAPLFARIGRGLRRLLDRVVLHHRIHRSPSGGGNRIEPRRRGPPWPGPTVRQLALQGYERPSSGGHSRSVIAARRRRGIDRISRRSPATDRRARRLFLPQPR